MQPNMHLFLTATPPSQFHCSACPGIGGDGQGWPILEGFFSPYLRCHPSAQPGPSPAARVIMC